MAHSLSEHLIQMQCLQISQCLTYQGGSPLIRRGYNLRVATLFERLYCIRYYNLIVDTLLLSFHLHFYQRLITYHSCSKCRGLLRPHVVWFGEPLEGAVLSAVDEALEQCDLCLLVCPCVCSNCLIERISF